MATDAALLDRLRDRTRDLPDWLRGHIARVVAEARRLAQAHERDPLPVQAAAWGHDLYRAHSDADLLRLAGELGLPVGEVERAAPILLHGPVAAAVLERDAGVNDRAVLDAIRWHTTACAGLDPVALLVFVADKIEPDKVAADPGLVPIHALAPHDVEAAALALTERRIALHLQTGQTVHPASVDARNDLLGRMARRRP